MHCASASRFHRFRSHLEVPSAATVFAGFALALFTWPGSGPVKGPPEVAPQAVQADSEARTGIRRIAITSDASLQAAPPAASSPLPVSAPTQLSEATGDSAKSADPDPRYERQAARRVAAAPSRKPSTPRKTTETRQVARASAASQGPSRTASPPDSPSGGLLDRTLTLGSEAVNIVASGAGHAKSAVSRLGHSVASLVEDRI